MNNQQSERMQKAQEVYRKMMQVINVPLAAVQLHNVMMLITKEKARLFALPKEHPTRKHELDMAESLIKIINMSLQAQDVTPEDIFYMLLHAKEYVDELQQISQVENQKLNDQLGNKPFNVDELLRNIPKS